MAALERETEISDQRLAPWRAGLPTLANHPWAIVRGTDGEWAQTARERQP